MLGILGESGSGKSVTLRALMRLLPPARTRIKGRIRVAGHEITAMDEDGPARGARHQGGNDLPGADDRARPRVHDRRADRRDDRAARGRVLRRRQSARARAAGDGADPVGRAAAEGLSARDVRRHAAAGDDRAGAVLPSLGAAGRRADHGARRDGADPDHPAAAPVAAGARDGRRLRHARRGCRSRGRRPDRRHVCRPLCRGRPDRGGDRCAGASLHGRAADLDRAGLGVRAAAGRHPRHAARPARASRRVQLRAALPLLRGPLPRFHAAGVRRRARST